MRRSALGVLLVLCAWSATAQIVTDPFMGNSPAQLRAPILTQKGYVDGHALLYTMTANGTSPQISLRVTSALPTRITLATLESQSSVSWLVDDPHAGTPTSLVYANVHTLVFAAGDVVLWDSDTLEATYTLDTEGGGLTYPTLAQEVVWNPTPVEVVHDGYIYGGMEQSYISWLVPGEFGETMADFPGGYTTFQDFAEENDTYIMPKLIISEAEDNSSGLMAEILPFNPDFVPIAFIDWGWTTANTYATGTFNGVMHDRYFNDDFLLLNTSDVRQQMDWDQGVNNPYILNPLGFTNVLTDTTWMFNDFAEVLSGFVSHSTNWVDNLQMIFDWAEDDEFPWWDGADRNLFDLDNDGVAYPSDTYFSPGDPTEVSRPWGDITVVEAYQIALRRMLTRLNELKPNILLGYNGQFGSERHIGDSMDYTDVALMERFRGRIDSGVVYAPGDMWLYVPTWETFLYAVGDYATEMQTKSGLPWAPIHWDTRENITDQADPRVPLETVMGEGAALLSNGVQSFAYLYRAGSPSRFAWALDDTSLTMNMGIPTGPVVSTEWGSATRAYENGSVEVYWLGEFATPTPYAWVVLDAVGDTIRRRNMGLVPDYDNNTYNISYYNRNASSTPTHVDLFDDTQIVTLSVDHASTWIDDTEFVDPYTNCCLSLTEDSTNGYGRKSFLYMGMEEALGGKTVNTADLVLRVAWANMNFEAGDNLHFCLIDDASGLGNWLDDRESTLWTAPSPGEVWASAPQTWGPEDFTTVVSVPGPFSALAGDSLVVDITDIAQAVAANPDDYYGMIIMADWQSTPVPVTQVFTKPQYANTSVISYIKAEVGTVGVPIPLSFTDFSVNDVGEGTNVELEIVATTATPAHVRTLFWDIEGAIEDTTGMSWLSPASDDWSDTYDTGVLAVTLTDSTTYLSWTAPSSGNQTGYRIQGRYDIGDGNGYTTWATITHADPAATAFTHTATDDTLAVTKGKWDYRMYAYIGVPDGETETSAVAVLPSAYYNNTVEISTRFHALENIGDDFIGIVVSDLDGSMWVSHAPSGPDTDYPDTTQYAGVSLPDTVANAASIILYLNEQTITADPSQVQFEWSNDGGSTYYADTTPIPYWVPTTPATTVWDSIDTGIRLDDFYPAGNEDVEIWTRYRIRDDESTPNVSPWLYHEFIYTRAEEAGSTGNINSWADLDAISDDGTSLSGTYTLGTDLGSGDAGYDTYVSTPGWPGIGVQGARFTGSFDGQGYSISDLLLADAGAATYGQGFFGEVEDATISNLAVLGLASFDAETNGYVGGFVGTTSGTTTITNCYSTGTLAANTYGGGFIGMAAEAGTVIDNCYSTVTVTSGANGRGGFMGRQIGGDITNCFATGDVTAGSTYDGGFLGRYTSGTAFANCGWFKSGTTGAVYAIGSTSGDVDHMIESGGTTPYIDDTIDWFWLESRDLYDTDAPVWNFANTWYTASETQLPEFYAVSQDTVGYAAVGSNDSFLTTNSYGSLIEMPEDGDIISASVYFSPPGASGNIAVAIYDTSYNLLASGSIAHTSDEGWKTINLSSSYSASSGVSYWVMLKADNGGRVWYTDDLSASNNSTYDAVTYANFPEDPLTPTSVLSERMYAIYVTYTP